MLLELALRFNWDKEQIKRELMKPSKDLYYHLLLKECSEECKDGMAEMIEILDRVFGDIPKLREKWGDKLPDATPLIELFRERGWDLEEWPSVKRKEFPKAVIKLVGDKKINSAAIKLFRAISKEVVKCTPSADREMDEKEYRGFQEFQMWCDDERNIQHRLRLLTFIVCKHLSSVSPSIIEVRIPNKADRVQQYDTDSLIFLNGYIGDTHLANVSVKEVDIDKLEKEEMSLEDQVNSSQVLQTCTLYKCF